MTLNPEWRKRVDHWDKFMPTLFYRPLGDIELSTFVTDKDMLPGQASKQKFKAVKPGEVWGREWDKGWFKGHITLPAEAKGQRIVLKMEPGGMESAVWINGKATGARDNSGRELLLCKKAKGGEEFDLLMETFGGNPRTAGGGPHPEWFDMPPHVNAEQHLGRSTYGIWDEELFQLWLDMETLVQLRDSIRDSESLRIADIDEALKEFTLAVDFELPEPERRKTYAQGKKILAPLLACHNGSTTPMMYCFGHSHIDCAWLWTLQETERKCVRTFSNQLALMEEYPEYKFLCSQAYLYDRVKTLYPDLYERIRQAVKKGQWLPEGSMWVEADTNITGGESLIRQFVFGKRFFKEEFGIDNELMWLPDVFGYSGAVPQIMKQCGVKWFSTQKIFWTYNGADPFPYNLFWWQGIDGTRMLSYIHNDYNAFTSPNAVTQLWNMRAEKSGIHKARLMPFGYGDGGGGPTRQHLEYLRREKDLEGMPKTQIVHPNQFFKDLDMSKRLPTWVGELYYQCHRGTYTSQARTKRGNRKSEFAMRELEMWGSIAQALFHWKYPQQEVNALWKEILINQFHDIIPGSSIEEVYKQAVTKYDNVIKSANALALAAKAAIVEPDEDIVTVFNSLSWGRLACVEVPFKDCITLEGDAVPVQEYDRRYYALVELGPSGWTTLEKNSLGVTLIDPPKVKATKTKLENDEVIYKFNALGELISAKLKGSDEEFILGPANSFHMYRDVPSSYDAWDVESMYKLTPFEIEQKATVEVLTQGPVFGAIRVTRKLHDSTLIQDIVLYAETPRLEFRTTVEWHENHKMLKVNFPVNVTAEDALHEIQFGHVARPTHATRPYDANRFEVCNQKWTALLEGGVRGAAVYNDCKYGVNVEGSSINLTLLRSPLAPDHHADKGHQEFTYGFTVWSPNDRYEGNHYVEEAVQAGYELNAPATVVPGDASMAEIFGVTDSNIIIECVKPADDGSGDVIIRLYESSRLSTRTLFTTCLPVKEATIVNMLEDEQEKMTVLQGDTLGECYDQMGVYDGDIDNQWGVMLSFKPFEIKTLRLKLQKNYHGLCHCHDCEEH